MKADIIRKGTRIDTIDGYEIVTGFNGSIVYTDSYQLNDEGTDVYLAGEGRLTISDIEHKMKEVDGLNHSVRYEEDDEC